MSEKVSPEEREVLDQFERRALHSVADAEQELERARQAARNTLKSTRDSTAVAGSIVKQAGLDE